MITSLSIENFALIEKLSINFSEGFSIITGETGAGKSILLGALGLVLGKRADLNSLKNKEEKCIVEAVFDVSKYQLQPFFEQNDLDYENETIIRREILPSGKSRAFINDSPVNLMQLQELGDFLIDIHSQNQTHELSEENYQFKILDAISNNNDSLNDYRSSLSNFTKLNKNLNQLKKDLEEVLKEKDYNSFLFEELQAANLIKGEQEELEQELEALSNVEFIKENLTKLLAISNDEQFGILQNLKEFKNTIQKNVSFSSNYQSLFERTNSLLIDLDDIVNEISNQAETISNDPERLEFLNHKLQLIYNLQKKHQVATVEELIEIRNELESKVVSVTSLEDEIKSLENAKETLESSLKNKAEYLRKNRLDSIPILNEKLIAILALLGMPNVRFKIELSDADYFNSNGKDKLEFLISANKGTDFGILKKVASGGEMSRIMLAVKSILAQYSNLPTILFDEIDTGVSGEIANKMGEIMKQMSNEMQVFAITHLPQIAAKGNQQFKVYKKIIGETTISELRLLNDEERIVEIAEMLSGKDISDSALNHAKALLN